MTIHPAPAGMVRMMVYGTLKRGFGPNRLMQSPTTVYHGKMHTVKPYILIDGGFPGFSLSQHDEWRDHLRPVIGEVYDVPESNLPAIDSYEGHPSLFARTDGFVVEDSNGNQTTVSMYVYNHAEPGHKLAPVVDGMYEWSR